VTEPLRLGDGWLLRSHGMPVPLAGWCILELERPAATLDALAPDEAAAMGRLVQRVSAAIRAVTACDRVYLLAFAEVRRQVHLHLVPRHGGDPLTDGWAVADHYRCVQRGERAGPTAAESEKAFAGVAKALGLSPRP
jgi:diadenosine tetraphosphate (Ap4A) HIT family hydrolase